MAEKLLRQKLIVRVGARKGFTRTVKADNLFHELGDDWQKWPLSCQIQDGLIDKTTCIYASDYKG